MTAAAFFFFSCSKCWQVCFAHAPRKTSAPRAPLLPSCVSLFTYQVGINESLMVLGKVIGALVERMAHVPYLECKLTTLLKVNI